ISFLLVNAVAIAGNFAGGWLARRLGNRRAIALMFAGLGLAIVGAFIMPRDFAALAWFWCPLVGFFSGVFGLFTMYLPPLFPTLLRTSGAGFCYNIGRIAAGVAQIVFGIGFSSFSDFRVMLLVDSAGFIAAAAVALAMPEGRTVKVLKI